MAWATSSLPDPLSPVISTLASERATRSISALRSIIAGLSPTSRLGRMPLILDASPNETPRGSLLWRTRPACAAWLTFWSAFWRKNSRDGQPWCKEVATAVPPSVMSTKCWCDMTYSMTGVVPIGDCPVVHSKPPVRVERRPMTKVSLLDH